MRKLAETLTIAFKIRPGEGLPTILLAVHSFFIGLSLVFLETSSYALFLTQFNIESLPVVYIISAVVTTGVGFIYTRMEGRLSFSKFLHLTVGGIFLVIMMFYAGILMDASKWAIMGLIIWYNVAFVLTGHEFWSLANRLLNVRQGKRLFGVIGSGEILAGILGGLSVHLLVSVLSTVHLILFSTLSMGVCWMILAYTTRKLARRIAIPEEEEEEYSGGANGGLLKDRYVRLIFGAAAFSVFGYYILDYVFYDQLELAMPGEDAIAGFLGMFIALVGVVNLFGNTVLHSRLTERYGLSLGLLMVPVTVLLGAIVALILRIPGAATAFFWVVVCTKGLEEICRNAIEEPSFKILHQPFPASQRLRAQTTQETIVEPLANALIGGGLILFTSVLGFSGTHLLFVMCAVAVVWITLAIFLRREYTRALTRALDKRRLTGQALSLGDAEIIQVLQKGLRSDHPGEVINCLNMLEEVAHESLGDSMIELLNHSDARVRQHVLEKIGDLRLARAVGPIQERLKNERDVKVMGTALRVLCAISEAEAFELVFEYLEDPDMDIEVKRGAMAGLLSNGGIDGVLSAGSKLNVLLESPKSAERKLAAQVLGEVGIASFYRPLTRLLEDEDMTVRAAAVAASGKLKNPRLLPLLIKNFSVPELSTVAVSAVINFGAPILPELEGVFDREDQTRQVRVKLIRIMGRIGGDKAIEILKKKIDFSEEDIRSHVLSALVLCKYQAEVAEIEKIHDRVREEVADAAWTLSVLVDIGDHEEVKILADGLRAEVEKNRKRIFSLLAMVHPADPIMKAQINLASNSKDRRANAMEILDNYIAQEIKGLVFPLLDDIPSSQRLSRLITHFPQNRMSRHERLKEILARSQQWTSSWTKTCALFVVGKIATREFYDAVISCLSDPDDVVRETAVWALGCMNPDDLVQRLKHLKKDRAPRVAEYARFVINSVGFAAIPMGKGGYLTRTGRYTADLFVHILEDEGERRLRRCRAANILSRFQIPAAREALVKCLTITDKTVRTAVLDALIKGEFAIEADERGGLLKLLETELHDAERILESIVTFLKQSHAERLINALAQEINHNRKRILSLLTLLRGEIGLSEEALKTMFYWYVHQDSRQVPEPVAGAFRRLLEASVSENGLRQRVFELFQYRNPARLKEIWGMPANAMPESVERHLRQIAFGSAMFALSWSRICALEMIVRLNLTGCVPRIVEKLNARDDVVRATAAWALFRLDPLEYRQYAGALRNDSSYLVSMTAKQLGNGSASQDRDRTGPALSDDPRPRNR